MGANPYIGQLAPAVGNGLGGLPRRAASTSSNAAAQGRYTTRFSADTCAVLNGDVVAVGGNMAAKSTNWPCVELFSSGYFSNPTSALNTSFAEDTNGSAASTSVGASYTPAARILNTDTYAFASTNDTAVKVTTLTTPFGNSSTATVKQSSLTGASPRMRTVHANASSVYVCGKQDATYGYIAQLDASLGDMVRGQVSVTNHNSSMDLYGIGFKQNGDFLAAGYAYHTTNFTSGLMVLSHASGGTSLSATIAYLTNCGSFLGACKDSSDNVYALFDGAANEVVINRLNSDGTSGWVKRYNKGASYTGTSIRESGGLLYLALTNTLLIVSAATGDVVAEYAVTSIKGADMASDGLVIVTNNWMAKLSAGIAGTLQNSFGGTLSISAQSTLTVTSDTATVVTTSGSIAVSSWTAWSNSSAYSRKLTGTVTSA